MSLASLIAKQKGLVSVPVESTAPQPTPQAPAASAAPAVVTAAPKRFGAVKPVQSVAALPANRTDSGVAESLVVARPEPASPSVPHPPADVGAIDSLDALSNSTGGAPLKAQPLGAIELDGETPAQAPTRNLPDDLTDGMKMFVESLDSIYDVLFDALLFGNMTRTIMQELQENPDYIKLVADEDVHIMIRGMREAMGLARIKKVEGKRKSPAAKKTVSVNANVSVFDDMFGDMDLS